jgi:TfoX N-terminal domain
MQQRADRERTLRTPLHQPARWYMTNRSLPASVRSLHTRMGVSERKMFGGIAFLHHGNMVCGVIGELLMLRLGAELADAALDEPHTRPMDFTGRPMRGHGLRRPARLPDRQGGLTLISALVPDGTRDLLDRPACAIDARSRRCVDEQHVVTA